MSVLRYEVRVPGHKSFTLACFVELGHARMFLSVLKDTAAVTPGADVAQLLGGYIFDAVKLVREES